MSAIVIGASALATVWPMLLHEIVHATAGWLNRRGHGPIFSPGPVPEMWAWVGVPLAALLTLGYATSEQPRLNRLRIGLAIAAVTWLILSVMTLGSWWANSGYEMLRSAGGIGAVWAGASGVLMVPIVLRDLAIRVFSPAGDRNMTAQRGEWLERSKAHSRSS